MSYSLSSLRSTIKGTIIGVIKGTARSLDYDSHARMDPTLTYRIEFEEVWIASVLEWKFLTQLRNQAMQEEQMRQQQQQQQQHVGNMSQGGDFGFISV